MARIEAALLLVGCLVMLAQQATAAEKGPGPGIHGVVRAVDAHQRTITLIETIREGRNQEFTYSLAEEVRVLLPGRPSPSGQLTDLIRGTPVILQLAEDRKTVIVIRVESVRQETGPLQVTIHPLKDQVPINDPFQVHLHVANTTAVPQSFRVMNCSWEEHWRSSNPRVSWVGWDCAKNFAETITLAPGQAYEKTLSMLVTAGAPGEKISFRLSFTPVDSPRTYWSNEVTVQVTKK